jgi:hemolysin III
MTGRPGGRNEELANSISHGVALVGALAALPWLLLGARQHGLASALGAATFGITVILLYASSTIYHAVRRERPKQVLRRIDHAAIYLLIAGTYTPFTLGVLRGAWGWTLFGLVWTLATAGVVLKGVWGVRHPRLSTGLYLAMGWMILVAAKPLWELVPLPGVLWLVAGGLAYTVGVAFYAAKRMPYGHFIWHLFVIAGTACHYVAVWKYSS